MPAGVTHSRVNARVDSSACAALYCKESLVIVSAPHLEMAFVKYLIAMIALILCLVIRSESTVAQPRAPNFQYFERPNYRYPYYDSTGRGKLLYGFGGPDLHQYRSYSPLEGIH